MKRQIKELEEINSFTCYAKQDDSIKASEEVKKLRKEEQKLLEEQTKLLHKFRDINKTVRTQNITSWLLLSYLDNGDGSRATPSQQKVQLETRGRTITTKSY